MLEILTRLKKHSESAQTRDDIAFIMDIIIGSAINNSIPIANITSIAVAANITKMASL